MSRSVFRRNGVWINKRDDSDKASSTHETQEDAYLEARRMIQNEGGGEIAIHGEDGKIREKNTIPPGNDDYPPKG